MPRDVIEPTAPIITSDTKIETDLTIVDTRLTESRVRNKLLVGSRTEMFKDDETFWITDSSIRSASAFCNKGTHFEWVWATANVKFDQIAFTKILEQAFPEAQKRWGRLPFSFIYHQGCPSHLEASVDGSDTSAADALVLAVNTLRPRTAVRLDPPQKMVFDLGDGREERLNGLVMAHSVPIMVDKR